MPFLPVMQFCKDTISGCCLSLHLSCVFLPPESVLPTLSKMFDAENWEKPWNLERPVTKHWKWVLWQNVRMARKKFWKLKTKTRFFCCLRSSVWSCYWSNNSVIPKILQERNTGYQLLLMVKRWTHIFPTSSKKQVCVFLPSDVLLSILFSENNSWMQFVLLNLAQQLQNSCDRFHGSVVALSQKANNFNKTTSNVLLAKEKEKVRESTNFFFLTCMCTSVSAQQEINFLPSCVFRLWVWDQFLCKKWVSLPRSAGLPVWVVLVKTHIGHHKEVGSLSAVGQFNVDKHTLQLVTLTLTTATPGLSHWWREYHFCPFGCAEIWPWSTQTDLLRGISGIIFAHSRITEWIPDPMRNPTTLDEKPLINLFLKRQRITGGVQREPGWHHLFWWGQLFFPSTYWKFELLLNCVFGATQWKESFLFWSAHLTWFLFCFQVSACLEPELWKILKFQI